MTVVKEPYIFKGGRVGTIAKSDRVYKATEEEVIQGDEQGNPILNENGEPIVKTETKIIFYDIRKKGTGEVYSEAVDILPYDYEEVSYEEMEAKYGGNKQES